MKLKLLILINVLVMSYSYGQMQESSSNFRLPPKASLKSKLKPIVDMSYKLKNLAEPIDYENIKNTYSTYWDLNDLEKYKNDDILYNYLKEASQFFKSVKPRYQKLYNQMELWYIYIYDINLSKQLTQ